jgi:hypothetical protein
LSFSTSPITSLHQANIISLSLNALKILPHNNSQQDHYKMAGGRKGLLSEEKADPSDMANDEPSDASEVEDGGSDDLSRDKDTGFPLTDAASGSDRRTWVGGQRIVQRRVYGPQPYNLDKYQHELVYHKKAGVYKGKPYKAGDVSLECFSCYMLSRLLTFASLISARCPSTSRLSMPTST